jgi:hypothetical protein
MKKLLPSGTTVLIAALLWAALGLVAQTPAPGPTVRQFPDWKTAATASGIAVNGEADNIEGYLKQDGVDIWNLQRTVGATGTGLLDRMTAAETKLASLPPPPLPTPNVEHMLVIPYGSTGFSITSLGALTEYPPTQRTRRKVDFTNVHQVRSCANIISPGATGSNFIIQESIDQTFAIAATISGPYDISFPGLTCSTWQPYTGPVGDQYIRVSISGSGSVTLDYISVQLR